MPNKDLNKKLLESSIQHWETILDDENGNPVEFTTDITYGRHFCSLCLQYNNKRVRDETACSNCPVFLATGLKYCAQTPAASFEMHLDEIEFGKNAVISQDDFETFKHLQKCEIEFLEGLLADLNNEQKSPK